MKIKHTILSCCFLTIMSVQATEVTNGDELRPLAIEIENQTPCFFFGGYQLSLGVRYKQFRLRTEFQNSGSMDFGQFGLNKRTNSVQRTVDNVSGGLLFDYFFYRWFFITGSVESRNWRLHVKETSNISHLRSLDFGVGPGVQYIFLKHFFFQISVAANLRQSQNILIDRKNYSISNVDCLPMIRLGLHF